MVTVADLVAAGGVLVLSGAGLSTESGIPDYRGPSSVRRAPMTFQEFTGTPEARRRYWARSHLGWRVIGSAQPNAGHRAVAAMQAGGRLRGIITQNVDRLHQAAGTVDVLELHGSLARVVCLSCGVRVSREEHARRLAEANPGFELLVASRSAGEGRAGEGRAGEGRAGDGRAGDGRAGEGGVGEGGAGEDRAGGALPDGDVALEDTSGFVVVDCPCGGVLKPDVVFFGETVPAPTVAQAFELTDSCRSLLVLGSSLTVRSGYRFVVRAAQRGVPIAIVNQGPTRGDELATVKVDAPLGETLSALVGVAA